MIVIFDGKTRVYSLLGYPVEHSFSPAMQNAAFKSAGLNSVYVPFSPESEKLAAAIAGIRALGIAGANVTVPHKEAVIPLLDNLTEIAMTYGAVNTIVNRGGSLTGHNTDGEGFIQALKKDCGFDPAGGTAVVFGAGGAARAVALALARSGCPGMALVNRSTAKAEKIAGFVCEAIGVQAEVFEWKAGNKELAVWAQKAALMVNCTSIGMSGGAEAAFPLPDELPGSGQLAYDVVYNPTHTVFMQRAERNGAATANGLSMLLRQGALSFEFWTGLTAPLEVMRNALELR
ncbi:shikimate dehydrogenase [Desulfotomaculum arcticum]|uniref:Shikimate dehydrogenase (NADP(+)) n=1 Tax=Desulfotruncus arcticus DSM 17038 TaxID=1121424 RepID=A0A1I2ZE21_9FIRM|nr:shikimate dehydrogenase [Desulfotruncus arcticus]SFH36122.1 shikimate dehydrogenase [Desulfotomaculum arcticum] [Desulfotruncus arcticus DSM 17038]